MLIPCNHKASNIKYTASCRGNLVQKLQGSLLARRVDIESFDADFIMHHNIPTNFFSLSAITIVVFNSPGEFYSSLMK